MMNKNTNASRLRPSVARHWPHLVAIAIFLYLLADTFLVWELNYYDPGYFFAHVVITLYVFGGFCFFWLAFCLVRIVHRWKSDHYLAALPLVSSIMALFAGNFIVDGTGAWLKFNDWKYSAGREALYNQVAKGATTSAGTYEDEETIKLPPNSYLSIGNGSVSYKNTPDGPMMLFLTFTGIPDGMSGFLYAPKNIDPKTAWPKLQIEWADVWDEKRHVYFVGNH